MKNYTLETLNKMLDKQEEKYYQLTIKPCGNWGDGMRLSKLPSITQWERCEERIKELKEAISKKKQEIYSMECR